MQHRFAPAGAKLAFTNRCGPTLQRVRSAQQNRNCPCVCAQFHKSMRFYIDFVRGDISMQVDICIYDDRFYSANQIMMVDYPITLRQG